MMTQTRLLHHTYRVLVRGLCQNAADSVRVRFAPSPTGQLHLGGMRTALYNYLFARSNNGTFILRIENTDMTRLVPGAQEKLVEMLKWGQINIDEGPQIGGEYGPYIQSERLDLYKDMINVLLENGTAYKCFCSERRLRLLKHEAVQRRETPKYDNRCRHLTSEEIQEKLFQNRDYVVRFKLRHYTEQWQDLVYGPIVHDVANIEGDPVLMKSDGYPTYHFANVVDDHYMKISHVLRGVEWQASTTKHLLLYKALGWEPPQFGHLPLLLNKDGKKLSKRQNDAHVEYYVNQGYYPESILSLLTNVGSGFKVRSTAGMSMDHLIHNFDISRLNTNSTRLYFDKLADMNGSHLRRKLRNANERQSLVDDFTAEFNKRYPQYSSTNEAASVRPDQDYILKILDIMQDRINMVTDLFMSENQYLWFPPTSFKPADSDKGKTVKVLEISRDMVKSLNLIDDDHVKVNLKDMCKANDLEFNKSMMILRESLSCLKKGPKISEMITMLGRQNTINRLEHSINILNNKS